MKRSKRGNRTSFLRKASGISGLELVCSLVVLIPVALFAVNIGFLGVATFTNDAACREAARVASQQRTAEAAYGAAQAAVQSFKIAGGLAGCPQVVRMRFQFYPNPEDPEMPVEMKDLKRTPTNNLSLAPYVSVMTRLNVSVPAPMFLGPNGAQSSVDVISRYSFPMLNGIDLDAAESEILGPLDGSTAESGGTLEIDD